MAELLQDEKDARKAAEVELQKLRRDLAMSQEMSTVDDASAERAQRLAEELEAEREKRVLHLQQAAARRIGQMGLAKGWQAWLEAYLGQRRCKQLLAGSVARVHRPKLLGCFKLWAWSWDDAKRDEQAKSYGQLLREQTDARKALQAEVGALRGQLKEAMGNSKHSASELEAKELAEKLETEREARVLHLQQVAARRIGQMELSKGWQAWHDVHLAALRCKQLLQMSANRLAKPKLTAAYRLWHGSWEGAEREKVRQGYELLLARHEEQRAAAEAELHAVRLEKRKGDVGATKAISAADAEARTLVEQLEAEREARVLHLQSVAARRIGQMELAKGWSRWLEAYLGYARCRQLLAQSAARLARPKLTACFKFWHHDWEAEEKAKVARGYEVLRAEEESLREQFLRLQADFRTLKADRDQQVAMLKIASMDEGEMISDKTVENVELRSQLADAVSHQRAASAEASHLKAELQQSTIKQKADAEQSLERLLANQRDKYEEEIALLKAQLSKQLAEAEAALDAERKKADAERKKALLAAAAAKAKVAASPPESPPKKATKRQPGGGVSKVLAGLDLDETDGAPPIAEQLRDALAKHAGKVLDLFREWDDNGDGSVDKAEFRDAMTMLGLEVSRQTMDDVFDTFDIDGGGEISYQELNKILRKPIGKSVAQTSTGAKLNWSKGAMGASKEGGTVVSLGDVASAAQKKSKLGDAAAKR